MAPVLVEWVVFGRHGPFDTIRAPTRDAAFALAFVMYGDVVTVQSVASFRAAGPWPWAPHEDGA